LVLSDACRGVLQAFVPLAVRAVPLPTANTSRTVFADFTLSAQPVSGLALVLIHQRSDSLALLVEMMSHQASCKERQQGVGSQPHGGAGQAAQRRRGCKAVKPVVTEAAAFQLLPHGAAVPYGTVRLGSEAQQVGRSLQRVRFVCGYAQGCGWPSCRFLLRVGVGLHVQGPLILLPGVLTTHVPTPASEASPDTTAAAAPPFPWLQFQPATGNTGGPVTKSVLHLSVSIGGGGLIDEKPEQQANGGLPLPAGLKRKAGALGAAAAGQQASRQQTAQPPPANQQEEQQQQEACERQAATGAAESLPEPLVTYFFCSYDGMRSARATQLGFRCPHAACRGLRCAGFAGLRQHLQARHPYQSYWFAGGTGGRDAEVYLRCKPGAGCGLLPAVRLKWLCFEQCFNCSCFNCSCVLDNRATCFWCNIGVVCYQAIST
jgi:hypothetical protein